MNGPAKCTCKAFGDISNGNEHSQNAKGARMTRSSFHSISWRYGRGERTTAAHALEPAARRERPHAADVTMRDATRPKPALAETLLATVVIARDEARHIAMCLD